MFSFYVKEIRTIFGEREGPMRASMGGEAEDKEQNNGKNNESFERTGQT